MSVQKYIKTKIIEAHLLLTHPTNKIMRVIYVCNSIDTFILDMREIYPEQNLERSSVLSWKFLTVKEVKEIDILKKLKDNQKAKECDATESK
jgi:hypothetical protein